MIKKIAKKVVLLAVMIMFLAGCNMPKNDLLPFSVTSTSVLKINDKEKFLKGIETSSFWKKSQGKFPNKWAVDAISKFPKDKNIWISYDEKDTYIVVEKVKKDDKIELGEGYVVVNEGGKVYISERGNMEVFQRDRDNRDVGQVIGLEEIADREAVANLFLNSDELGGVFGDIFDENILIDTGNWGVWDIFFDKGIRMSGTLYAEGSKSMKLKNLKNSLSLSNDFEVVTPSLAVKIRSFWFEDSEKIFDKAESELPKYLKGLVFYRYGGSKVCTILTDDVEGVMETLNHEEIVDYEGFKIEKLGKNEDVKSFIDNFDFGIKGRYALGYKQKNCVIVSDNIDTLKDVLGEIISGQTLKNSEKYKALKKNMPSMASYNEVNGGSILQITPIGKTYVCNFVNMDGLKEDVKRGNVQIFTAKLENDAQIPPKWVINHKTGRKEVAIQDKKDIFYLIDTDGKIIWKKKLEEDIVGSIWQVDLFDNGKLQMVFNTKSSLVAIDRNGDYVEGFPKKFEGGLMPLEVFDYEGDGNYRFMVCSKDKMRVFDKKGKEISFEGKVEEELLQTPKHFRIGDKDYIVFEDGQKLRILQRNGKEKVEVEGKYDFSDNGVYLRGKMFCFTTKDGNFVEVNEEGEVKKTKKAIVEEHFYVNRHNTDVFMGEGELFVNGRKIRLEHSVYSKPLIYRIGANIYISFYDLENKKIYMYNGDGKMYAGYPLLGTSDIDLSIDQGRGVISYVRDGNMVVGMRVRN